VFLLKDLHDLGLLLAADFRVVVHLRAHDPDAPRLEAQLAHHVRLTVMQIDGAGVCLVKSAHRVDRTDDAVRMLVDARGGRTDRTERYVALRPPAQGEPTTSLRVKR